MFSSVFPEKSTENSRKRPVVVPENSKQIRYRRRQGIFLRAKAGRLCLVPDTR